MLKKTKSKKVYVGYLVMWTESESDWGCRPDGASIHLTQNHVKKYIKKYWDGMPPTAPYEYSGNDSDEGELVVISKKLHDQLKKKGTIRLWQSELYDLEKSGDLKQ